MLFMTHYDITPERRNEGLERFLAFGEGCPAGVKLLNHYQSVTMLEGWGLIEADNAAAITKALYGWTDLNVNNVIPVVDAAELQGIVK